MRVGCVKSATKRVALTVCAVNSGPDGPRAELHLGLRVCDEHATPDPHQYITDEGWARLALAFMLKGKAPPARDSVRVRYDEIQ